MKDHTSIEFGGLLECVKEVDTQLEETKVEEDHGMDRDMEYDAASRLEAYAEAGIMDSIKDSVLEAMDELSNEGFSREEAGSWITGQVQDIVDRGSSKR